MWTTRQPLERFLGGKDKNRSAGDLGLRVKIFLFSFFAYLFFCLFSFVEEIRISKRQ